LNGSRWSVPRHLLLLGLAGLLGSGCTLLTDDGRACPANIVVGHIVGVRDSVTGVAAGRGAFVGAREGAYSELLQFLGDVIPTDSLTFVGATERAGTYLITVTKAGYLTWVRTGVRVVADECHVHPVTVEVRLQPATP
jgi:hypothetical protein